jgi:hypothetical protein
MTFNLTENGTTTSQERMRLNNKGFLGIGTTNPLAKLQSSLGSSGVTPNAAIVSGFFESSGNNYLNVAAPEANESGIAFGKPSNGFSGGIYYDGNRMLSLRTGTNDGRFFITANGKVGIGNSNPVNTLSVTENSLSENSSIKLNNATTGFTASDGAYISADTDGDLTILNSEAGNVEIINNTGSLVLQPNGNVGVATNTPDSKLDVFGDFSLSRVTVNSVNGGYNDLNRAGASVLKFTNGGILNGISGGVEGMMIYIYNTNASVLTLTNQNIGSAAVNRIITPGNINLSLNSTGGATLIYDGGFQRWRVISVAQ